ncbi:hypothetical protein TIFTF001_004329 [Ficus carica]|uniref:Cytochrome P450 n=1 Tax=Ficus carica TaxID=3494 RepID=A0AA88CX09_FICCA|nr:hypothetical protein TIFTF001_004329 [Ficus carica]
MLVAGTDTTTITIEWAMSLLLNHPKAMHKARAEIEANVGHDRLVNESDLPNLSYLHNVINETWRLFPSIPVMPRESADDCTISGFHIPKGTMMLLNVWTIHRDEKVWENATSFIPERFERDGAEANKLFMFGGGRRTCPGAFSARRVVTLALASLIQSFEWERIGQEAVNLAEQPGLHMSMVHPLEALCKPHHAMIPTLNKLL